MKRPNITYVYDYESKDTEVVSRVLGLLADAWQPDYLQMEWVPDNDRYEEGLREAPLGIKSQLESGLVRLGRPREAADEEWLVRFAPRSFSVEFFDGSRRVLIDIADASSLTVELRGDARAQAPQLLEIFESLGMQVNQM